MTTARDRTAEHGGPDDPRSLLIVSSIPWDHLWQRHQALAVAAATDGWQVDFLQPRPRNVRQALSYPFRRIRGNRLAQAHGTPARGVHVLGRRAWLSPRSHPPYDLAIVYLPDALTEWFLRRNGTARVVYDAVMDWAAVPRSWFPPIGWRASEKRLAKLPGASVMTDAVGMADLLQTRGMPARVVPPAADEAFIDTTGPEFEERRLGVLYFGAVREEVDVAALIALKQSGVPVDVIGRAENATLEGQLGAHGIAIRAPLPVDELAAEAVTYRVLVLPYRGERARALMPAKFWNCVATGSWVVAKGLTLPQLPNVVTTSATQDFVSAVRAGLETPPPGNPTAPSWESRWQQVLELSGVTAVGT